MMNRRKFIQTTGASLALAGLSPAGFTRAAEGQQPKLTPPAEIEERVRAARPLLGGRIPANLADRLGATHYGGSYHLTEKPFLIEGAEAISSLGMRVGKFWLQPGNLSGYAYNSDWRLVSEVRLAEVLHHPYYAAALAVPFTTIVFEVPPLAHKGGAFLDLESDFADEEKQFHEVAAHLFKAYAQRDITFILQHWEGDWMLRGKAGAKWDQTPVSDLPLRCETFIRFLAARQRGVESARREAVASRCKVYHAAEVNKVCDTMHGIAGLTTHVLPHVTLDLVSWSSYDGMGSVVDAWQGMEWIRQHMRPSPVFGGKAVYIGEIGKPENESTPDKIVEWWDRAMGVFLALDIPWILDWEIYCNEPKRTETAGQGLRQADGMRGFWLLRPDGSLSYSGEYLTALLKNAGKGLPEEAVLKLRNLPSAAEGQLRKPQSPQAGPQ